ncbi:MAG TPA: hypothetical protein VFA47_08035, partial [Candidatus Manganitrophaceae bacterium]|nr:hypothetical protein [Candidatus Manganitrophaceae bacterium]
REIGICAALAVMILWVGIYPLPFVKIMDGSIQYVASRVEPKGAGEEAVQEKNIEPISAPEQKAEPVFSPVSQEVLWEPREQTLSIPKRASGLAGASARGVGTMDSPKEQALWGTPLTGIIYNQRASGFASASPRGVGAIEDLSSPLSGKAPTLNGAAR